MIARCLLHRENGVSDSSATLATSVWIAEGLGLTPSTVFLTP